MNHLETVSLNVGNCTPQSADFLRNLVGLFTDPTNAELLRMLHAGEIALHMNPGTGGLFVTDIGEDRQSEPMDVVAFIGRFNDTEWETLVCLHADILVTARQSVPQAEKQARELLGYLPIPTQLFEPANG